MRRPLISAWVSLCALLICVAAVPGTVDAGIETHGTYDSDATAQRDVNPWLKWLYEGAVQMVFGSRSHAGHASCHESPEEAYDRIRRYYGNEVVLRFNVTNSEEEGALRHEVDAQYLDVWSFNSEYADVRIRKDRVQGFLKILPKSLREPKVYIADVATTVWETYPVSQKNPRSMLGMDRLNTAVTRALDGMDNIFFHDYQPLPVITSWLKLLEAMFPTYVELFSIGKSYEGRDIIAMRVGEKREYTPEDGKRKTILVTGGIHAREWISTTTVNYLIWSFVTAYGKEPLVTKLIHHFDVVFMPVLNPDGYEFTWHRDRLWRKSRQQTNTRFCRGLDLDRAFGYEWDTAEHQRDPCSESYGGDQPFQAVEASALAAWAKNETENNVKFVGFLDLHSYSQQVLFPFSYSCSIDPANRESLEELAVGLAKAIRLSSGESYSVASACEGATARSYSASGSLPRIESGGGSAIDWFYHEVKAKFSYQIKLRDTGSYGFLLPREQIVPTGEEMTNALKYFGDFLLGNNGIEKINFAENQEDEEWKELRKRKRR